MEGCFFMPRRKGILMEQELWILASASPRRRELLRQIGIEAKVQPAAVSEDTEIKNPEEMVLELSSRKAEAAAALAPAGSLVLGADTVVSVDGMVLGKPASHEQAREMIRRLQGRTHQVYTGVTMIRRGETGNSGVSFAEKTDVTLFPMTEEEIQAYADSPEPMDKAGAYGIQGSFAAYVSGIRGDYGNVVGLPIGRVYQEWKRLKEEEAEEDD